VNNRLILGTFSIPFWFWAALERVSNAVQGAWVKVTRGAQRGRPAT